MPFAISHMTFVGQLRSNFIELINPVNIENNIKIVPIADRTRDKGAFTSDYSFEITTLDLSHVT
jgi:hypothetical protein